MLRPSLVRRTGFYVPQEEAASGQPSALMTHDDRVRLFLVLGSGLGGGVTLSRRVAAS